MKILLPTQGGSADMVRDSKRPEESGAHASLIGQVVGNVRLLDLVGRGSVGCVFKGRHERLQRTVAVKLISEAPERDQVMLQRFIREGLAAARLDHANVVRVLDAGESAFGAYLTMEYVDGPNLGQLIAANGPLSARSGLALASDIAAGLCAIHAQGVLHRDIKPENMLISARDKRARIADFGIAKLVSEQRLTKLTLTGILVGTPIYVAPELIRDVHAVTPASDIYALGATLHYQFAGQPTFAGEDSITLLKAQLRQPAPPLASRRPDLPPAVSAMVDRCLERDPARRPAAGAVLDTLIDLSGDIGVRR